MPTTKPIHKLTFHDRLSRLTFIQAAKLLGEEGRKLIMHGAKYEIDVKEEVYLTGDLLRVRLRDGAVATLTLMSEAVRSEEGRKLIMHGAKYEIDVKEEVYLTGDLLRVRLRDGAVATLTLMSEAV